MSSRRRLLSGSGRSLAAQRAYGQPTHSAGPLGVHVLHGLADGGDADGVAERVGESASCGPRRRRTRRGSASPTGIDLRQAQHQPVEVGLQSCWMAARRRETALGEDALRLSTPRPVIAEVAHHAGVLDAFAAEQVVEVDDAARPAPRERAGRPGSARRPSPPRARPARSRSGGGWRRRRTSAGRAPTRRGRPGLDQPVGLGVGERPDGVVVGQVEQDQPVELALALVERAGPGEAVPPLDLQPVEQRRRAFEAPDAGVRARRGRAGVRRWATAPARRSALNSDDLPLPVPPASATTVCSDDSLSRSPARSSSCSGLR